MKFKRMEYTMRVQINDQGFVAQKREDITGVIDIARGGYFVSESVLQTRLSSWTGGPYVFFTTKQNELRNARAQSFSFEPAMKGQIAFATIAWTGYQHHDYTYINTNTQR